MVGVSPDPHLCFWPSYLRAFIAFFIVRGLLKQKTKTKKDHILYRVCCCKKWNLSEHRAACELEEKRGPAVNRRRLVGKLYSETGWSTYGLS